MLTVVIASCLFIASHAILLKGTVCKSLTVQNGKYACHTSHLKPGTICDLKCDTGYAPSSPRSKLKCLENGHWSKPPSKCNEIRCPNPLLVANGVYSCDENNQETYYKYKSKCHLTCGLGFKPSTAAAAITCLRSGQWSAAPECKEIVCPDPPKVANGLIRCQHGSKHVLGDTCGVHCDTGYRRSSVHDVVDISCLSSSSWSTVPSCVEIKCPHPPKVANGVYKCNGRIHKLHDICHLHCSHGYTPHSTASDIHCTSTDTWSIPSSCDEILCPNPPTITNGVFNCGPPPQTLGKACSLKCGLGFRPNSTNISIHCLSSRQWSAASACVEIQCPRPPSVTNGQYKCLKPPYRLNHLCHLQCNTGYRRSTNSTDIHCLGSDFWSKPGQCTEVTCPDPPTVRHGTLTCPTKHNYNSICKLTCNSGFKPNNPQPEVRCLHSGQWAKPPSCQHITCPNPPKVTNGFYKCDSPSYHLNTICTLHCDLGFKPQKAHSNIKCLYSETWTSQSSCVEIHCPPPPTVDHGHFKCNGTVPHQRLDTCMLTCNHGYKPSHLETYCTNKGHWSPSPTCEEIQCSSPKVTNGSYNCDSKPLHKQDDICDLQCDIGFKPNSRITHTRCLSTGLWSHSALCVEIQCLKAPMTSHGKYVCDNRPSYKLNDVCHLRCDTGYHPTSSVHETHCQTSETWSTVTQCAQTICPAPPNVSHGVYKCVNASYKFSVKCSLQCNSGFKPNSKESDIRCLNTGKWSPSSTCHEIACPDPPKVANGAYQCASSHRKLNNPCNLTCNKGFEPRIGTGSIRCLYNESWSNPTSCVEIRCSLPPDVVNGRYNCSSAPHKLGDVCQLECDHGYKSTSHPQIQCRSTDTWSTPATCSAIQCPAPPRVSHGKYHCQTTKHGLNDVCTLQCDTGYKSSSHPAHITCLSTNTWSQQLSCLRIRCPVPPAVINGSYHCTANGSHLFADVCHLQCNTGYKQSTKHSDIHCLETDLWSQPAKCQEIRCPVAPKVLNGVYRCTKTKSYYKLNEGCSLQCNTGFVPNSNNNNIHCMENNQWSPSESCREIRCPSLPQVTMGTYHCNSSTHSLNTVCHLQCFVGYRPTEPGTAITCLSSELWSSQSVCRETRCPDPPSVPHGIYTCASKVHEFHDVCHLQCASGFTPSSPYPEVHCQADEKWSPPATCKEIQCPQPKPVANGKYICGRSSHYKQNDVCQLRCNHGYKTSSDQVAIVCLQSSTWSKSALCIEILCPAPPRVVNGNYDCGNSTDHKLDSMCRLRCDLGYRPENTSAITCLHGDKWSDHGMCVEIQCPAAPKVNHGTYTCSKGLKLNDRCHLECETGYKPNSKTSDIHCTEMNTWSAPGQCIETSCPDPPLINNGRYACTTEAPYRHGDRCDLECHYGFKASSNSTFVKCLTIASWSTSASCVEVQCSAPVSVTNGTYDCGNSTIHKLDDVCSLVCSRGYKPATSVTDIQCLHTEEWSTYGGCVEIQCHSLPVVSNGVYKCDNSTKHTLDDVCNIRCNQGYKPNAAFSSIHCIGMNQWSAPVNCVEIRCPAPPKVSNGLYSCGSEFPYTLDTICSLQCNHGYRPDRVASDIQCLSTDMWSDAAVCEEIHCPEKPNVLNGEYICSNTSPHKARLDDTCHLQCSHGYRPESTSHETRCLSNGQWSVTTGCIEIQCYEAPKVLHGKYHCSEGNAHSVDQVCHLQCDNGYRAESLPSEIYCLNDGSWSSPLSCKEVLCPDPPKVVNGTYLCQNKEVHKLNDECRLQCDSGFKPSEDGHTILCQTQDTWSPSSTCVEKRCDGLPVVLHGKVVCNSTEYSVNIGCDLQCDPGFKSPSFSDKVFCLNDETWTHVSCVAMMKED